MEYNEKDLKFDNVKYFEDYENIASEIVEDLANFTGGMLYPTDEEDIEKIKAIARLPIYRGYIEIDNGKRYVDAYKYQGNVYSENELTELIDKEFEDASFGLIVSREVWDENPYTGEIDSVIEQDVEPFPVGVSGLFYYKAGPDGKGKEYFEPYEEDSDIEL